MLTIPVILKIIMMKQEDCEFKPVLDFMVILCLNYNNTTKN